MTGRHVALLPGLAAHRAGHRLLPWLQVALALGILLLWLLRGERLGPALTRMTPLDLGLAAGLSLLLLPLAWLSPGAPRSGRGLADRLARGRGSRLGLIGTCGFVLVAVLAPALAPFDPAHLGAGAWSQNLPPMTRLRVLALTDGDEAVAHEVRFEPRRVLLRHRDQWTALPRAALAEPQAERSALRLHLLGTDHLGRDILSRLLIGARASLAVGLAAALLGVALGGLIGTLAALSGPAVDALLMRGADLLLAVPRLLVLLLFLGFRPGSTGLVVVLLGLTGWMGPARLARARVHTLRGEEFVTAARAAGARRWSLVWRHILPQTLSPLLVATGLRVGETILLEASLSFLGLGTPPPQPSWGGMIAAGRASVVEAWWVATFPGLALAFTVAAINLAADGLRDALDPRSEGA